MTGWQDSFQPQGQAQPQGWQASFQPDNSTQEVGTLEDIGKSGASGLAKDVSYLANPLGLARQVAAPIVGGATRLAGAAYEGIGGKLSLPAAQFLTNPLGDGNDTQSIIQNQIIPAIVQAKTGMNMNYQPQTGIGAATQTATQALPFMMAGDMSIPEMMARAAGVGGGSELGGAAAQSMGFGDKGQEVGKVLGGGAGFFAPEGAKAVMPAPKLPISDAIKQNLLNQNPDIRTYAGEDLGQRLSGAEQNAFTNKEQAYQAANPVLAQATVPKNATADFQTKLQDVASQYDPDLVPASKSVARYADEFGNDNFQQPTTLEDYESLRQKLNKIPIKDAPTSSLVTAAKGALDDHLNDVAQRGLIQGDPQALKLITDARAKNAEWRQQFTGNQANAAIKGFIEKQGGLESVAPETLLDQFTRVGQAGFDNVRAAKEVLGNDAAPILKQGYLNKVRAASVDQNGEIVPKKLQANINTLIQKNPTLSKFVFTPEELQGLQGISNTAGRYAQTGAQPGIIGKVVTKIPIAHELFGPTIKAAAQAKMMKNISNPRTQ